MKSYTFATRALGVLVLLAVLMSFAALPAAAWSPPQNNKNEIKFLKDKICLLADEVALAKFGSQTVKCWPISCDVKRVLCEVADEKWDLLCDYKSILKCQYGICYDPQISCKCQQEMSELRCIDKDEFVIEILTQLIRLEIKDIKLLKCARPSIRDCKVIWLIDKTLCVERRLFQEKKDVLCDFLEDLCL